MLTEYIEKAMRNAYYEKLNNGSYAGKIHKCEGTVAFGTTLYECQVELREALEGWLIVKIRHGDEIPIIEDINLNSEFRKEPVKRG